jgi:drug/metabolite transporter (DMT)-like permease
MSKEHLGELAALATAVLWTLSSLAWTSAGRHVGALAVAFIRLVLAVALYLPVLYAADGMSLLMSADLRAWETLAFSGFLGFFVSDLCLFKAFLVIGPRLSLLVNCSLTAPLTVVMSAAFRGGGGFGYHSWIGMGITLAGVLWVVLEHRGGDEQAHTPRQLRYGLMLALAATAVQAAGTVLAKEATTQFPPASSSLVLGAATAALIRVLGAVAGYMMLITLVGRWPTMVSAAKRRREMIILAGGTIVGPCLGVTTYMIALSGCHEGVVTTILATIPVMILPFSVFLYHERVSLRAFAGALIAMAGVAVLMWRP